MRLQKLNRNYNGYHYFSHRVEFYGPVETRVKQWIGLRNWLWGRFGPSAEQALARADNFDGQQPKWAWDGEKSAIYLKDEALTEFLLVQDRWR